MAEVGDGQKIVLALLKQLADGVDLGALEAVAGTLGEFEVFDGEFHVRAARGDLNGFAEPEALRLVAHLLDELHQGTQGAAGRRKCFARA